MPKFSVVISVYNKEDHIAGTLQSVLNQTYSDFEIIIVNDASTDTSERVIRGIKDERISYYASAINQGAGATRNTGISKSSGEYIALLDGDDVWEPTFLEEILRLQVALPQHAVFATAVLVEDKARSVPSRYSFDTSSNGEFLDLDYFESSLINTILTSSSAVVHQSVFKNIGTYDSTIKSGQDTDLWIRIGLEYRIGFSTKQLVTYRYTPHSLFKSVRSVTDRPDFLKFIKQEKKHPALKKFIDLNRYSLAIRSKLWGEHHLTATYTDHIHLKNLNRKQRLLLKTPATFLKIFFKVNGFLEKIGLRQSAF